MPNYSAWTLFLLLLLGSIKPHKTDTKYCPRFFM
jgi:hypothetical protein